MGRHLTLYALAVLTAVGAAAGAPSTARFVRAGDEIVLLTPTEVVAPGEVRQALWSPDGRYVLSMCRRVDLPRAPRMPPHPAEMRVTRSMHLWSTEKRATTELWKSSGPAENTVQESFRAGGHPNDDGHIQAAWLPGTGTALALVSNWKPGPGPGGKPGPTLDRWLYRIEARGPTMRAVYRVPFDARLHVSPARPEAVLAVNSERVVRILRADGQARAAFALPPGFEPAFSYWAHGGLIVFPGTARADANAASRPPAALVLDLAAGKLSPAVERVAAHTPPTNASVLSLYQTTVQVKEGDVGERTAPLWLAAGTGKGRSVALVAPDADWGRLSPNEDAILYVSGGAAWVTPLWRMPYAAAAPAIAAARHAVLMSQARQLGLAVQMFAQDNDGRLPGAGEPVQGLLMPYLKDEAALSALAYTYEGGPLSGVQDPANTVLGFLPSPQGRFLIFVDGHVRFSRD